MYHNQDGLTDTERVDKRCRLVLVFVGPRRHGLSAEVGLSPRPRWPGLRTSPKILNMTSLRSCTTVGLLRFDATDERTFGASSSRAFYWPCRVRASHLCVGEASAKEDRRVEDNRFSDRHERCACYATARLMLGNGAHTPTTPPICVGEASYEEAH